MNEIYVKIKEEIKRKQQGEGQKDYTGYRLPCKYEQHKSSFRKNGRRSNYAKYLNNKNKQKERNNKNTKQANLITCKLRLHSLADCRSI